MVAAPGPVIEMDRGVDMRAGVVAEGDRQRLRADRRLARRDLLVMVVPYRDDHGGMARMGVGAMKDLAAEIDDFHGRFSRGQGSGSAVSLRWRGAMTNTFSGHGHAGTVMAPPAVSCQPGDACSAEEFGPR